MLTETLLLPTGQRKFALLGKHLDLRKTLAYKKFVNCHGSEFRAEERDLCGAEVLACFYDPWPCVCDSYVFRCFCGYMTVRNVLIPTYFASHGVVPYRYNWGMLHTSIPVLHIYDLLVPPKVHALKPRHLATY